MTEDSMLALLKSDLQIMTSVFDDYLKNLLSTAFSMIKKEGINLTTSTEDINLQVMYAAYLYRMRANPSNPMPRMLRYALNNRLLSEKMRDSKYA